MAVKNENKELTGGIILNSTLDEIILVKGRKSGKWGLPKGHIEPGETYIEGALREIKEETGLDIKLLINVLPCILSRRAKLFLFSLPKEVCHFQTEDSNEIMDVKWIKLEDLKSLPDKTMMLRGVESRMMFIKKKITKNRANYQICPDFKDHDSQIVINGHLYNQIIPHFKKNLHSIIEIIQKDFPRMFYKPELQMGITEVKKELWSRHYTGDWNIVI